MTCVARPCIFPFKYGSSEIYNQCPEDGNGNKWCSTEVTFKDGEYIDGEDEKWGMCSRECEKKGNLKKRFQPPFECFDCHTSANGR